MYSSIEGEQYIKMSMILQLYLEPLFYQNHVDINLFAHIHSYERSCPMFQGKCIDDGITNLLIGMAGQDLTQASYKSAGWSKYHDKEFGYSQIWANRTYLYFKYYHNVDNALADQFVLRK